MLGTEPELVETYVETGQVKIIFWPVINHGNPSVYATAAMECAGQQDVAQAWAMHERLFTEQRELYQADLGYFADTAVDLGLDQDTFVACYGSQDTVDHIMALDAIRRERGVFSQPVFDLDGQATLIGSQPFRTFAGAIDQLLDQTE